jgi:hypothetical protein
VSLRLANIALNNFFKLLRAADRDEAQARAEIAALVAKHGIESDQRNDKARSE